MPTGKGGIVAPADSDEDFLHQTASTLAVPSDSDRPDLFTLKWFGYRPQVEAAGIDFEAALTVDYSKNFNGGLDTGGNIFRHLLDLRVDVDTRALFGWQGGLFSIDFQNQNGKNGSDFLTGDEQGFDNADADGRTQISELWYQQVLFDQRLRIKVGKVDANSEFAFPEYGAPFINSSFGHSPTIFPMPTYPDPAMSVNAFVYPVPWFYAGAGIYDGSGAGGNLTGSYGPKNFFTGNGGYFFIGELGTRWVFADDTLPGRFAIGGWASTSNFTRFNGSSTTGTGGIYAMLEQTIWHKKFYDKGDAQGIAAFFQYGHDDEDLNDISDYAGAGVTWTGPLDSRKDDIIGAGLAYVKFSDDPAGGFTDDYELSVESFYSVQLTNYFLIKPDLQYIINPGGTGERDALVFTMRATLAF